MSAKIANVTVYRCYWTYVAITILYTMENVAIKIVQKGEAEMTYNTKTGKENTKEMDYNNSSRRFRPWGSRVKALSIKCDSLALRTESRQEWISSSGINCMSVWEWLLWERNCSETVVSLDLMLVLSTASLCSLNLVSPIYCKLQRLWRHASIPWLCGMLV